VKYAQLIKFKGDSPLAHAVNDKPVKYVPYNGGFDVISKPLFGVILHLDIKIHLPNDGFFYAVI